MKDASTEMMSIFCAAVEQPAEERAAFVEQACGQNVELRGRIDELLRAHDQAGGFLPEQAEGARATIEQNNTEGPGTVIGPYKLLQQIGEGGMGVVWMAEQMQPVQRKVALKVIKPGMDSRQVIARFEAERQALSMMDHVNIARVFDGGATKNGRPYFVMELVHGVPITTYCDDNRLTPQQRLELFVPVCHAIQHAHQKGIIHRDIKPSNVMVTLYDGKPVPKVIDFGVAKATEQKLTERTLFTQYGTMVGTLEYMSPEQAEMSALGVDTRSDIYSLGVLLYELLTGSTPLTHKRMKEAAYAEIVRMIKEEEPPRPSTRLSDSGEALASISANRHTEPAKLTKLVKGELDWIVMKTLEKDRNRRYETANGFAADVMRYLNDEPVQACPPSAGYRLRKFARRNKRAMATAALVGVTLVVGTIVSILFAFQAHHAANDAFVAGEDKKKEAAKAVKEAENATRAQQEAERVLGLQLVTNGVAAMDKGDVAGAAIYFADAARRDRSNPERSEKHRLRVANALRLSARPEHILFHDGDIRFAALSPDGTRLVTAGANAQVWDAQTCTKVGPSLPHDAPIGHAVFSKDSRRLLTSTHLFRPGKPAPEQNVRVWDVASGRLLTPALVHEGWGNAAFMLDEEFVLTRTAPTTLQLWHAQTGKPAGAPLEHPATSNLHLNCSPDGQYATTVTVPPYIRGPKGEVKTQFAPNQLWLWNLRTRQATTVTLTAREIYLGPEFSPDGTRLVYNDPDDVANVLDVRTGKRLAAYHRPGGGELWHAFAPAAGRVFTWTSNPKVPAELWDLATGRAVGAAVEYHNEFDSGRDWGRIGAFAVLSPDGRRVLAPLPDETPSMVVWDTSTGKRVGQALKHETMITRELFSPDGRVVVTASDDGVVQPWQAVRKAHSLARDVAFAPLGPPLMHQRDVWQMFFSVDGRRLFTVAGSVVRIWPLNAAPQPDARLEHPHAINRVLRSVDGQRAVTISRPTNQSAEVRLWDLKAGKLIGEPKRYADDDSFFNVGATISPDSRHILVNISRIAESKKPVQSFEIGDVVTGRWQSLVLKSEELLFEQFSATGKYVLFTRPTGISAQHAVKRLIETTTAQDVSERLEKTDNLNVLGWSPDDHRVLTQVNNGKSLGVRIWDLDRRQAIATVLHEGAGNLRAQFSANGRCVMTEVRADEGAEIRLWDAQTGAPMGPLVQIAPKREALQMEMVAELSPDGVRLLVAGMLLPTGTLPVRIWDLTAGTAVELPGATESAGIGFHRELPRSFSPDGRRVLAKTANGLRVFDGLTGVPLTPEMTPGAAFRLRDRLGRGLEMTGRLSRDGRLVLTANPAQIWDADTGQPLTPPMPAGVIDLTRSFAFGADGDPVVVQENSKVLAVYRVSATEKPLDDLAALAETLAGRRLNTSGSLQTLETDRLASGWKTLRVAEPAPRDGPAETLDWHRRQVGMLGYANIADFHRGPGLGSLKTLFEWAWSSRPIDLIERTDAFAAVWHLDRVLARERAPSAVAARGYAHFVVGEWDKAVADFTEAMAGGIAHLSGPRGEALAELGRFDEARTDFLKALAERPGDQVTSRNDPRGLLMKLAYSQAALGDKVGLRETLSKVRLHVAALKPQTREATVLLWTLALEPGREPDLLRIVKASEDYWLPRKIDPSFDRASPLTAVGLARFRLGDYEAALAALTEAETFGVPDQRQVAWLLLAMVCQKMDRPKEARAWFDKASNVDPRATLHWIERLVRRDLRRHAEELLK